VPNQVGGELRKLLKAVLLCSLLGTALHLLWFSANLKRGEKFGYEWSHSWPLITFTLIFFTVWLAWGLLHRPSRSRVANLFQWDWLLRSIEQSLPVTRIVPGALIAIYAAVFLLDLQRGEGWWADAAKKFNYEIMHIDILCWLHLNAYNIFRLETLGFSIGLAMYAIAFMSGPYAYVVADRSAGTRAILVRALRTDGHLIPLGDMRRTLEYYIRLWDPVEALEWRRSRNRLERLVGMPDHSPTKGLAAASVILAFPVIEEDFGALTDSLFNTTKPVLRLALFAMLVASTFLVLLPITLRAVLLFFPVLEGKH
jgi:hypothetical protein